MTGHTIETIRDYRNQGNYFQTWIPVHIPGTDNEDYRYSFPRRVRWFKPKQLSSLCHLYDKKRAMVEALGGGGWIIPLEEYKVGLSLLGVYGLNLFVPHIFSYSTDNPVTVDDFPPSWFYQNPYWKYFKKLSDLARRISFIGTQGYHVCDVCLLYPITTLWAQVVDQKEDVGTLGGGETGNLLEIQYNSIQDILLENLIDYDIIDPDSILRCDIDCRKLNIAQEHFAILIIPPITTIQRSVAEKIKKFFDSGGILIALNMLPMDSMEVGENDGYVINVFKEVFGFDPRSVRIGYLETDTIFQSEYIVNTNQNGGRAYFTKWTKQIPKILTECVEKDVIVISGNCVGLRVLHRKFQEKNIYFLVNEQKISKSFTLSFRNSGQPALWDPETGEIETISNFMIVDGRAEIPLTIPPLNSFYIVFTPSKENTYDCTVSEINLERVKISRSDGGKVIVEGLRKGDDENVIVKIKTSDGNTYGRNMHPRSKLQPIMLDGKWKFTVTPKILDNAWTPIVTSALFEIPLMKFHPERGDENGMSLGWHRVDFIDADWKQVKIKDEINKQKGCGRYLSCWDGAWITYYRFYRHWGTLGGEIVYFKRTLNLDHDIDSAWMCITADQSYELFVNGKKIGNGLKWNSPDVYDISNSLKKGTNVFQVKVNQCQGLLVQGEIKFVDGNKCKIISDSQWLASDNEYVWLPAFSYVYPPLGPWGNVINDKKKVTFPTVLWYRQVLPIGTKMLIKPQISGSYQLFVNGQTVNMLPTVDNIDLTGFMLEGKNVIAIRIMANNLDDGIIEPIQIICGSGEVNLGSWTEQGLYWYSGKAVYSKVFDLPNSYIGSDNRLLLELGDVRYCAEIWINDKLVKYSPWSPHSADITDFVHPGHNQLVVVVANLLANEKQWDIFDSSLTNSRSRFLHEGVVLREPDCLKSGLIGPVNLIPLIKENFEIMV
jgi:hypothetical protein